jgi:general secretion pathway protein G
MAKPREVGTRKLIVTERGAPLSLALLVVAVSLQSCRNPAQRSKEATLREDLRTLRTVLDQYRGDKGRGPNSLEQLVREGYLRVLPSDPFTKSRATWRVIRATVVPGQGEEPAVVDVRSGARGIASDGTAYSSW